MERSKPFQKNEKKAPSRSQVRPVVKPIEGATQQIPPGSPPLRGTRGVFREAPETGWGIKPLSLQIIADKLDKLKFRRAFFGLSQKDVWS